MTIILRGSIYLWKSYNFEDGTTKDKYWLALTCTVNGNPIYAVLPTSQYKHYEHNESRCYDTIIIEENESTHFPKKTIIDLKNVRQENKSALDNAIQTNQFIYVGQLEEDIMNKIKNAIENAYTLPQQLIDNLTCEE